MRKWGFSRPNPGGEPPREARGVGHVPGGFGDWPDVVGLWATGAGPQRAWNVSCVCVAHRSVAGTSRVGAAGPLQGAESPRGSGPVRGAEAPVPRGLSVVLNLSGADPGSWEVEPGVRPQRVSRLACPSHPCAWAFGLPGSSRTLSSERVCLPSGEISSVPRRGPSVTTGALSLSLLHCRGLGSRGPLREACSGTPCLHSRWMLPSPSESPHASGGCLSPSPSRARLLQQAGQFADRVPAVCPVLKIGPAAGRRPPNVCSVMGGRAYAVFRAHFAGDDAKRSASLPGPRRRLNPG